MKWVSLNHDVIASSDAKVLSEDAVALFRSGEELLEKMQQDLEEMRSRLRQEAQKEGEEARERGLAQGLEEWSEQLLLFEQELGALRVEFQKKALPIILISVQKIVKRKFEADPTLVLDTLFDALKSVLNQKKVHISVHPQDLALIEGERSQIVTMLQEAQSVRFDTKESLDRGSCRIETEKGVLHVSIDRQIEALEKALQKYLE